MGESTVHSGVRRPAAASRAAHRRGTAGQHPAGERHRCHDHHNVVRDHWIDTARQATTYRTGRLLLAGEAAHVYASVGGQGLNVGIVDAANLGWKLAAVACGWVGEDILDAYTTERHPVAARLLQNTRAQIALMRPDPQTRALWEMFSDLMDLDDAHRCVADMLAGMDVRYDLGHDHRLVGTLCLDMKLTLERPGPSVVTAVIRSVDLLCEGRGLLFDLVNRAEACDAATGWTGRVNTVTARTGRVDIDALLIRPGGCVAWALPAGQGGLDAITRVRALGTWFGQPA
ncbi:FAD-dependent monooxygenase [Streptomyces bobili]|uniref:FAD-dependent monooxygenase n=1 Tax=Streptomyces bobili TaxID=67280 RepID=UPI0034331738